ncbi:MAG: hypothetical protein WBM53_07385 [Maribacter sp.]
MELIIGALVTMSPEFMGDIVAMTQKYFPVEYAQHGAKADLMIPIFILKYLPHGFIELLIVGILSAAMSSLSSTVNSLSAVSVEDFLNRGKVKFTGKKYMLVSRMSVLFWGAVCVACSFLFGGSKSAVIEILNAIGSVFYGPVLVTFILAMFSKKVNHIGMNAGILVAVLVNFIFSKTIQDIFNLDFGFSVFWIWLNFLGVLVTLVVAYVVSFFTGNRTMSSTSEVSILPRKSDFLQKEVFILLAFFVAILVFSYFLPQIFS